MTTLVKISILLLFICCPLLWPMKTSAQSPCKIKINLVNASFSQFVEELEKQCGFRFFYNNAQLDSFRTSIREDSIEAEALLNNVFKGTRFVFSVDREKNIFLSSNSRIITELPADFFLERRTAKNPGNPAIAPVINTPPKEKLSKSIENKIFEIGEKSERGNRKASLAGYIQDAKTGEPLAGVSVYVDSPFVGVFTDQFGYFSMLLPRGYHVLRISSVGMKETRRLIQLYSDGKINIQLQEYIPALKEVIVQAEKKSNVMGLKMGAERLNIKTIKQVPVVFGEADILRVVLTLPGVSSVGEASTGFNVRGGAVDQNLILYNDATVYNPSHLFGFFSAFNPDVVKSVELYKSSIPEKFGGRLSSVLDVTTRNGNARKLSGSGGIGLLTGKLTLEGPLQKDKASFIAGARSTYSDWLLNNIPKSVYSNSTAGFYDVNLLANYAIDQKNTIYLTSYLSNDRFRLNRDTVFRYGNRNINLKWKHNFGNKLYLLLTGGIDNYQYSVGSESNKANAYKLRFSISQYFLRADFTHAVGDQHNLNYGINIIQYQSQPGSLGPGGGESLVIPRKLQAERGLESAIYFGDEYKLSDKLSMNMGLRYSMFNFTGPRLVYTYVPGVPRDENSLVDSINYSGGKFIKTYHGPEFRFSTRYILTDNSSLKFSYNTLRQYIHALSNTASLAPTDTWKLSDTYIRPQLGQQFSLGYYHNFRSNSIETSAEIYYKALRNYVDFKSGAQLLMNSKIEADIINTRGRAYGIELMLKKASGKLNGWISYAYSRTFLQMDDPIAGEIINNGDYYPASFDKPHTVNFISNYRFSHRYAVSLNTVYSTGRPITLPLALFDYGGSQRVYYSQRNQYRIPDYFRVDLSVNIEGNHKIKKLLHSSWSFGVYNISFRQNPYSVYFVKEGNVIKGYQLSIFGTAIPFITYNFKF